MKEYEAAARAALAEVTVELWEFPDDRMGEYDPDKRHIRIDGRWAGLFPLLFHELMHHAHYHKLAGLGVMEEPTAEAWEDALSRHVYASKARRRWWHRALAAKLSEAQ